MRSRKRVRIPFGHGTYLQMLRRRVWVLEQRLWIETILEKYRPAFEQDEALTNKMISLVQELKFMATNIGIAPEKLLAKH